MSIGAIEAASERALEQMDSEEVESDRSFDPEILALNKVMKLIRKLSGPAKAYVLERLKTP